MNRLFGKAKPKVQEQKPTLEDATGSINTRMTDLDSKIKALDDELRKFKEQMKKATGNASIMLKKRAMDTLKRKKMYETQRDQLANQQFNIDQTVFAIETVKSTQITVSAMKDASKQLKLESAKISLNEIEDMQDDLEDLLEDAGDISEILSRSYATPDGVDEDDLEAELACLGDELESIDVDETPAYLSQPSAAPQLSFPEQPTSNINPLTGRPNPVANNNPQTGIHEY